jgi:hypothetical protein
VVAAAAGVGHVVFMDREARLKAALRANLARRKAQERAAPIAAGSRADYPGDDREAGQEDHSCKQDS